MNTKGAFTALVGLMVLTLIVSATYFTLTSIQLQESPSLLRQAGDLKRTFNKARFMVDEEAAQAMADYVVASAGCTAAHDYTQTINQRITDDVLPSLKSELGADCSLVSLTPLPVMNQTEFNVKLQCASNAEKNGELVSGVSTVSDFNLQKNVVTQLVGATCEARVTDMHTGLEQATASS
jgi:hypothetical protein